MILDWLFVFCFRLALCVACVYFLTYAVDWQGLRAWWLKVPAAVEALDCRRRIRYVTLPRLWIWIPAERRYLPAALPGTLWDLSQWRMQYRARHVCTAWLKG